MGRRSAMDAHRSLALLRVCGAPLVLHRRSKVGARRPAGPHGFRSYGRAYHESEGAQPTQGRGECDAGVDAGRRDDQEPDDEHPPLSALTRTIDSPVLPNWLRPKGGRPFFVWAIRALKVLR